MDQKPRLLFVTVLVALFGFGCDDTSGPSNDALRFEDDRNQCAEPCVAVDLDADATADRCEPTSCETFAPVDCDGAMPVDLDGDGCARECPGDWKPCGGLGGASCADDEFCDYALVDECGAADQQGVCRARPEVCTEQYQPVCSCNGITYGNECEAHRAGVSVLHWGRCDGPVVCPAIAILCEDGEVAYDSNGDGCEDACAPYCGGFAGFQCEGAGEVCFFPEKTSCGSGDQFGYCAVPPDACYDVYAPVCGCDGKTYGNDCEAAAGGASILHDGACD